MEKKEISLSLHPHVLIFPLPLQGPVNSMLKLAELLCMGGLHVTFLVTHHISRRNSKIHSYFSRYPAFYLETVSDGLPEDHPRNADSFMEIFDSLERTTRPLFKETLRRKSLGEDNDQPPVTCVIGDGILGFTIEVAREIGLPIICTRTISPCFLWLVFCLPKLFKAGELPFEQDDDLDVPIKSVPGMEGFLRRRDLPSFCRAGDSTDPYLKLYLSESRLSPLAYGLILNSFEELEGPILSHIRSLCPNLYMIGPLHAHLKYKLSTETTTSLSTASSSFREDEDRSCLAWLDDQPEKSVIYVSFGSIVVLTSEQMTEFRHGLMNSGHRFLWVIREDGGENGKGWLKENGQGFIVRWAPQEEVLAHPSVGGFLTHSGWNSTLESIFEGMPMLCWPYFVDQQLNSRFVGQVWKLGLDMKDSRDRVEVDRMVRELMSHRFDGSANEMAIKAKQAIKESGSSSTDLNRLIEDIKAMTIRRHK